VGLLYICFTLIWNSLVRLVVTGQQAGAVANQPVVNAVNTRMNAAAVQSPVQATVGNVAVRPAQSTLMVGPTAANTVQPAMSVIGGRMLVPSTTAVSVPRPAVPANPSLAGAC